MDAQVPIDVAAGLVFHEGRLLVTQRKAGSHLAGLWEFPGGKRESGESWESCLQRELREELGIETAVGMYYDEVLFRYPTKTVHLRFFLVRWVSGAIQAIECEALRWVARTELDAVEFPPADQLLIHRLRADATVWNEWPAPPGAPHQDRR
ncbi:MAG: 8-oxo-dGTP diphosphatase MutT [Verrucomicrobiales bacterium]|nr:8-oxo-dGTP diphosphatase MutT [Verrucomicrobiales bacterium]